MVVFLPKSNYFCNNANCYAVTIPFVVYLFYAPVPHNNICLGADSVNVQLCCVIPLTQRSCREVLVMLILNRSVVIFVSVCVT